MDLIPAISIPGEESCTLPEESTTDQNYYDDYDDCHDALMGSDIDDYDLCDPVASGAGRCKAPDDFEVHITYEDMDRVYTWLFKRLGPLIQGPRTELLNHLLVLIEPEQKKRYPYSSVRNGVKLPVVSPAWWPKNMTYESPARALTDGKRAEAAR